MEQKPKIYDLEKRTETFARNVRLLVERLPRSISNLEYSRQLIRSSSSIGANYIEANDALGKKDFAMRMKICRKEAKETAYWLRLLHCPDNLRDDCDKLLQEVTELTKIFGAIIVKTR